MACLQSPDVVSLKLSSEQLLQRNEDSTLLYGKCDEKHKQCRSYVNDKDLLPNIGWEMVGCLKYPLIVI